MTTTVPLPGRVLALAGRGGAQRARLLRGVLHLGLHPARARGRHRGPDHRGGAGLHLPAVRRGLAAQVDACLAHDTADRLGGIAAPTLVISGGLDTILPPRFGRSVAGRIPGARFEVMAEESHQPFQEVADDWNAASMPSGARPKARVRRNPLLCQPDARWERVLSEADHGRWGAAGDARVDVAGIARWGGWGFCRLCRGSDEAARAGSERRWWKRRARWRLRQRSAPPLVLPSASLRAR